MAKSTCDDPFHTNVSVWHGVVISRGDLIRFSFSHCRGQVLNAEMISNVVDVELILDGIKYSVKVSRVQHTGIYIYIYYTAEYVYTLYIYCWIHTTSHPLLDMSFLIALNNITFSSVSLLLQASHKLLFYRKCF